MSLESKNPEEKPNPDEALMFDGKGNPRTLHTFPDGTTSLKSEEEFQEEMESYEK